MIKWLKKYDLLWAIIGLGLIFVSLNIIVRLTINYKQDMTAKQKYSLSPYSQSEVSKIERPIFITIYYSPEISSENPLYDKYAKFVMEFIAQYQRVNPDKIFTTLKNPEPYSQAKKEAQKAGLKSMLAEDGQTHLYFGAVFAENEGKEYKIPEFSIERSFWLEKDITTIINHFNQPERKQIGLISPLHKMIQREYGKETKSFAFIQELSERYDILEFALNITEIPKQIKTLIVVAPQKMPQSLTYALDQYLLRGGNLILLLDKLIEEPLYQVSEETTEDINKLLRHWGIEMSDKLSGSHRFGSKIFLMNTQQEMEQINYPLWLKIDKVNLPKQANSEINHIELRSAASFILQPATEELKISPIITLSQGSAYEITEALQSKKTIAENLKEDKKDKILAVWVEGKAQSLYQEIPNIAKNNNLPYLYYSNKPAQIFAIADSDFIRDDVWLQENNLNDNGQLLLKIIEIMNDNEGMAELYKSQQTEEQTSLGGHIYQQIISTVAPQIERLKNEENKLLEEEKQINFLFLSQQKFMDIHTSEKLNNLSSRIREIQEQHKYYEYSVKKLFESKIQNIMLVNIIIIPFLILLIWIVIYNSLNYCRKKRIKDQYNGK